MPAVRLGKMVLRWCKHCNIPIISSTTCSMCGNNTIDVIYTPPGDIRPAFDFELDQIKTIIDDQFGNGCSEQFLPLNKLVILNHAPDLDRLDEVIFNGEVQGAIKFDLVKKKYKFLMRLSGAKRIIAKITKSSVIVDDGAIKPITKGSSALAPGIVDATAGIMPGDEVIVLSKANELLGVGIAQMSTEEMLNHNRGVGVKIRWHIRKIDEDAPNPNQKAQNLINKNEFDINHQDEINDISNYNQKLNLNLKNNQVDQVWSRVITANRKVLDDLVKQAKKFILSVIGKYNLPVAVSFSGGKDSLATLSLVLDAGVKPDLFFIDTGLEFPETIEHVKNISKKFGLSLITRKPINTFWDGLSYFGPPGKDYRWCCKTCKLGPTTRLVKEQYPNGVLAFIGQRRYESEQRSHKGAVWQNPWVPGQIGASPIQQWTAMHIWLYLFNKGIEFNKLYAHGMERIGCWLCPASDLADLIQVSQIHPDYNTWMKYLRDYSKAHSLSSAWVDRGIWRWKKIPKGIRQLLKDNEIEIKIKIKDQRPIGSSAELDNNAGVDKESKIGKDETSKLAQASAWGLQLHLSDGYSNCKHGLSLEGVFNKELDMSRVVNLANILGKVEYTESDGYCTINGLIDIFPEGALVIKGKSPREIKKSASKIHTTIIRAIECIGCGICMGRCENNALVTDESDHLKRIKIIEDKCTHCGKCLGPCPVVNFNAAEDI